jgi:hypothetical protein
MSGILQFSLGLTAGGFASAIASADHKLHSFTHHALSLPGLGTAIGGLVASFASLHAVVEGVMGAIEKGAALEHLSKRSGVAVGELYSLQKGFTAVGLEAGDVSGALFAMQRSLGGVNEMGESTSDIFSQLGLNVGQLKTLTGPQQLLAIMERINKLDQTGAASAASKIFGRGQAGNMLQIARSTKEFSAALKSSAEQAAIFQRSSRAFEDVERGLAKLRGKANGFFAGLAEGVAPGLKAITDSLNKIDITGIGVELGKVLSAFAQAFKEGTLGELIGETLKMGIDLLVLYAPAAFEKLGGILLKAMEGPLTDIQAGMEYALDSAAHKFATSPAWRAIIMAVAPALTGLLESIGDTGEHSFAEVLKATRERGVRFDYGTGEFSPEDIQKDADERMAEAKSKAAGIIAPWQKLIDGLSSRARGGRGEDAGGQGSGNRFNAETVKPTYTELEKMGFVMNGLNNPAIEYARNTAANTARLVALAEAGARPTAQAAGDTIDNS